MDNLLWNGVFWQSSMEGGRIIHPSSPWYWCSRDMVKVDSDDVLSLSLRENIKMVHHWDGEYYYPMYESGVIRSVGTFSYGRFSAEIMLPKGRNLWPSFWLVGDGKWPASGEIDIMEAWCDDFGRYFRFFIPQFPYLFPGWKTTNNVHFLREWPNGEYHDFTGSRNVPWILQRRNPTDAFVEYSVEWTPERIDFFVGDHAVRRYGKDIASMIEGNKMHIIFNLWCENPDECSVEVETPMRIRNFKYEPFIR